MSKKFGKKDVTIRLIERMLGTVPKDKEVYKNYIATKKPDLPDDVLEEELATVEQMEDKGWTGFHTDENGLFLFDYLCKGFLKAAMEVCMEMHAIEKIVAYKKWMDLLVFVWPRRIYLGIQEPDGVLERPLRTMTPKGPRVALSRSDYIEEGREIKFQVEVLRNGKGLNWESLEQALDYGRYVGLGQWRGSGGYGRFELVDIDWPQEDQEAA